MNQDTLDITLLGRDYRVACSAGEREALLKAAEYVNSKMRATAEKTQATGERLAAMVALNIAHDFLSLRLPGGSVDLNLEAFRDKMAAVQLQLDVVLDNLSSA
jgi:cell division protein ZapA